MGQATRINITAFKQKCLQLLRSESLSKAPLEITRRGEVIALVTRPDATGPTDPTGTVKYRTKRLEEVDFSEEWPGL
jgi:hypothetical protein